MVMLMVMIVMLSQGSSIWINITIARFWVLASVWNESFLASSPCKRIHIISSKVIDLLINLLFSNILVSLVMVVLLLMKRCNSWSYSGSSSWLNVSIA